MSSPYHLMRLMNIPWMDAAALPDTFTSCKEYSSIFESLIHLECQCTNP